MFDTSAPVRVNAPHLVVDRLLGSVESCHGPVRSSSGQDTTMYCVYLNGFGYYDLAEDELVSD